MNNNDENNNPSTPEQTANWGNTATVVPNNAKHKVHYLTIIGQIEGHNVLPPQTKTTKYEFVIPQLITVAEDSEIEGLMVILNTVGGDVEAGLAIAEMISNIDKPSVSLVLGGGHSIGVPLAVSAKKSFIVPSATMTLHPIRMSGTMIGASQTYEYFNKVEQQVVSFVERNSQMSGDKFRELMTASGNIANDLGTILFGEEAVNAKLIDSVGGVTEAIDYLYSEIEKDQNTSNS
ncbi:MAG: ATP-dependent Clp protease proteolytic subunit [Eubacteriales bacterium]|nr:ATP-dependent Clp protease proteolytic subunit [Eubacteriales bacterium]